MGQGQSSEGGPHLTTQQVSHELVRSSAVLDAPTDFL